ncbi:uncharacterized protein LOC130985406 [Salvia miltiorrhiza]|uniref:uncharacterized protein LOC130985406 n=1 Tax=Salvia miltiorrhiza TaxID=226208 RepID=UPI0025ACFC7B|nr:uncharacterized protein LOC130985406 [Salvia miltiorrhiza]
MDKMGDVTASGNGKVVQQAKRGTSASVNVVRAAARKDRHSKVCTAGGTRDRRVRLSPKTAILFYDLQDRLGCDRPSKAIDWLMAEAKAAIDALADTPAAADPPPPPPPLEGREDLSAPAPVELFDANSEMVRLQRIFSWNYGEDYSSAPLHYPAEREPLQSTRINANYYPQFQGFGFSDQELPNFCKDIEMPVFSKSSSFLDFEE